MTTDRTSAQGLLRQAANLVELAIGKLDVHTVDSCAACGHERKANLVEARLYDRLSDTPERLRAAADKLDGNAAGDRL